MKEPITPCPRGKVQYKSHDLAQQASFYFDRFTEKKRRTFQYAYKCSECGLFHLSSENLTNKPKRKIQ